LNLLNKKRLYPLTIRTFVATKKHMTLRFDEFNFEPEVVEGIEAMGFEEATPIQEKAIPPISEGKDVLGLAQTGTGKTAAFLLPVVNKLLKDQKSGSNKALVIVPTRELAMQIDQQMEGL
jgi:superfamily II DNA/RNA helicase